MSQLSILNDLTHKNPDLTTYSRTKAGDTEDWCPTFLPELDKTLQGGLPLSGKMTEIYGVPKVGKSTLALECIKTLTKLGAVVVVFDTEGTASNKRMAELGIDPNRVLRLHSHVGRDGIPRPITVEEIFETMIKIANEVYQKDPNRLTVFMWDTVAATLSKQEADAGIENKGRGEQAHALSTGFKNATPTFEHRNATLFCLNQARANMNALTSWGRKVPTTVGGRPVGHAASLILLLKHGKTIKAPGSKDKIGHQVRLVFKSSKMGSNAGEQGLANIYTRNGSGFDFTNNIYSEAKRKGLIQGTSWQSYQPVKGKIIKEHGSAGFINFLHSDKGKPVLYEIWQRLIKFDFPKCYPPLFNQRLDITKGDYPFLKGIRNYYIKKQEQVPSNEQDWNYKNWKSIHPKAVKKAMK